MAAIWDWIRKGKLKAKQIWTNENRRGRHDVWIVPQSEIDRILKARENE